MAWSRACAATISRWMPANSRLLSARLRPRVPRSARVSGLAIRMTSVLCSSPSAPMLTSFTIQATLPLPQRECRPESTSSSLAPPILRQSREAAEDQHRLGGDGIDDVADFSVASKKIKKLRYLQIVSCDVGLSLVRDY